RRHAHVAVFARGATGLIELYAAPLPPASGPIVLPAAWRLDDEAGPETLVVVLSPWPVTAAELHADSAERAQVLRLAGFVAKAFAPRPVGRSTVPAGMWALRSRSARSRAWRCSPCPSSSFT